MKTDLESNPSGFRMFQRTPQAGSEDHPISAKTMIILPEWPTSSVVQREANALSLHNDIVFSKCP